MFKLKKLIAIAVIAFASVAAQAQYHASLAEQKMCATQAASVFNAWKTDYSVTTTVLDQSYVNHYDARTHICYVMTHSFLRTIKGELLTEVYTLTDAFEKSELASYYFSKDQTGSGGGDKIISYVTFPRGGAIQPKSAMEFRIAVSRAYGIS